MAKSASKKKTTGEKNRDRRCGRAWKKGDDGVSAPPEKRFIKPKVKTIERKMRDLEINEQRMRRRLEGMARHQEELRRKAEQAELEKAIAAEKAAQEEEERQLALRQDPLGVAKRMPKQRPKKRTIKEMLYAEMD